jgi:uncharacterized membrane protein YbhN (UPF0104 family)
LLPAPAELARGTLIGHFYNTFVPGSVGGDLVRAYVMRPAFETARTGLALVVGERLLGLSALALMAALGALMGPSLFDGRLAQGAGAGLAVGAVGLGAAAFLWRRGHLERLLARAPTIHRPADIAAAWGVSVVGHALNIALYTQLAVAMDLPISAFDLACLTPLALIASVVPLAMRFDARISLTSVPTFTTYVAFTFSFSLNVIVTSEVSPACKALSANNTVAVGRAVSTA